MWDLAIKAIIGAIFVIVVGLLMGTNVYFLAGLLALFPTFGLMAHYLAGTMGTTLQLKNVVVFGMWSIIPYFSYLTTVYFLCDKTNIYFSLGWGLIVWFIFAGLLVFFIKPV
jgi:membrane protein GlpM